MFEAVIHYQSTMFQETTLKLLGAFYSQLLELREAGADIRFVDCLFKEYTDGKE